VGSFLKPNWSSFIFSCVCYSNVFPSYCACFFVFSLILFSMFFAPSIYVVMLLVAKPVPRLSLPVVSGLVTETQYTG